ncbi:phage-like element PBSX protein XkdM [Clostridium saccharobutylicum]|uniref:phage tail tube protein n=1 Tax=Clostridium saccharobutylicum TaxID=169679 RepID=UPI000983DF5A|nr:phage tail tube protein [Clostridium saccharobutylicum]AQS09685.1 phage-like element PBSX protein XkdM [Clostridium saccharobutylicum]MBC2436920.1 terminase [Clostridium saccharobutylicum]NSB89271.1 hypothetical protein [Clostridium saccharobutylicum]NYC27925.1 hypothetical protein [Clostridium saccharobutylicum]OOM17120.1 phage-like element PBSX protein XkdM [Clostridium saccharobutylicum]
MANTAVDVNQILKGNNGEVWFNNQYLATLKTIKATLKGDFTSDNFIGDNRTYSIYNGWSGEGSLSFDKVDSYVWNLATQAYKSGVMPDLKIITSLTNSVTSKSEKVSIEGVMFSQFDLINIESKKITEESYSFTFSDFDPLETM